MNRSTARTTGEDRADRLVPAQLAWPIALLALVATGVGLFWRGGPGPVSFTTVRGEVVDLYGDGLYRFDAVFQAAAAKGTDFVTLVIAIPLLLASAVAYRRGAFRGGLLLLGTLGWFLYAYAGYALGTNAYNELFLVYVILFSASLFAFVAMFRALERAVRERDAVGRHPGVGIFMLVSGVATLGIWLVDPLTALIAGRPPAALGPYTTLFTYAVDLAIIVPAAVIAGVLLLRRVPLGIVVAAPLLVLEAMLAPMIAAQTVSHLAAGVTYTPGEIIGPIAGFVVLSVVAAGFLVRLLQSTADRARVVAAETAP